VSHGLQFFGVGWISQLFEGKFVLEFGPLDLSKFIDLVAVFFILLARLWS